MGNRPTNNRDKGKEVMKRTDISIINLAGNEKLEIATRCLICDESVSITYLELYNNVTKICDKCKQAVIKMRETIEHKNKGE